MEHYGVEPQTVPRSMVPLSARCFLRYRRIELGWAHGLHRGEGVVSQNLTEELLDVTGTNLRCLIVVGD